MSRDTKTNSVLELVPINLETGLLMVQGLIYSIVNSTTKTVVVGSTSNLYEAIGRAMSILASGSPEFGSLKEELKDCSVCVLETNVNKKDLKLRQAYWISYYREKGFKFYKELNPLRYTLETDWDYREGKICYFVSLKSRRSDKLLIAVFRKRKEMKEWIRVHYPDTSRISKVVYQSSLESSGDSK